MNIPQFKPKLTTIPEPPTKFGDDGGQFYRSYDALADELDDDMVKSLKSQLDSILIFAGLFAGINSAFLALTLPEMSADPADDTNALLLQLVTGGNGTIRSAEDLPSATFAPSAGIFPVNVLFSLSLTLAFISSFLAVLGQQWLVYYRKRSGGGAEYQRWEQLRRHLGAKRWGLETILDDILPGLLLLALVIFCIAFVAYLRALNRAMCYVIMGPITIAVAILLLMAIVAIWDRWCPFKSPLSHLLHGFSKLIRRYRIVRDIVTSLLLILCFLIVLLPLYIIIAASRVGRYVKAFLVYLVWNRSHYRPNLLPLWRDVWKDIWSMLVRVVDRASDRPGENIAELEAMAAKRVLCTSEDFNALLYTAINLQGMTSKESVQSFLGDEDVYVRLKELWESGRRNAGAPNVLAGAFSRAFLQLVCVAESAELLVEPRYREQYSEALSISGRDRTSFQPLMQNVEILDECIDMGVELLGSHRNDSIWLLYYWQILKVTLDEEDSKNDQLEGWLNQIIAKYPTPGDCKPHVICLVAWGKRTLNIRTGTPSLEPTSKVSGSELDRSPYRSTRKRARFFLHPERGGRHSELANWLERHIRNPRNPFQTVSSTPNRSDTSTTPAVDWDWEREWKRERQEQRMRTEGRREIDWSERPETNTEHFFNLQQQRVKTAEALVGSVGWEKTLVPKARLGRPQETVLGLIREVFDTYSPQSPRRRDKIDVWLLEQALAISTTTSYYYGSKFVVTSSIDLLRSLHEVEATDGGQHCYHDSCFRLTRILLQCVQPPKERHDSTGFLQLNNHVLEQLQWYLPRFTADLEFSWCDISVLSMWLEVRETICETLEGWARIGHSDGGCRNAYLRVKSHFDNIESAMLEFEAAPNVDGDPADPPSIPPASGQAGPSRSPGTAVTEHVTGNTDETGAAYRMQEYAIGSRGDEAASVNSPIGAGRDVDQQKQTEDASSDSMKQDK